MASMLVQAIVAHNPIEALVMARSLARQGFDTTETQEAAIAALVPRQPKTEPEMKLPEKLNPLARDEAYAIFEALERIKASASHLPYHSAVGVMANLETIRETIGGTFPGGFNGDFCDGCDHPLGGDETAVFDRENLIHLCADCAPDADVMAAQQIELRESDPANANLPDA